MKLKIILTVFALALVASVFVCGVAYAESAEPWNVTVDVVHQNTVYHYNLKEEMQPFTDKSVARGFYLGCNGKTTLAKQLLREQLPRQAVYEYLLPNFKNILRKFQFVNVQKRDAKVEFDANGFCYKEGVDGVSIDVDTLFWQMLQSGGRNVTLQLPLLHDKAVTVADLRKITVKKASFTTYFAQSGANRCHNVAKATSALNGVTILSGETFSFNKIVGPRTENNGYKESKIILDGVYADGIGGGVCQVSTTLYNALLLSEILPAACQHTLVSSYVQPGFDAMVSYGGADLTFTNDTGYPLYIAGKVNLSDKSVTFTVYGRPNVYRVVRESVATREQYQTVEIVDAAKYPELVYVDQTKVVTTGSDGVISKSYLCYYNGDKLVLRKLIRQNTYKRVDKVVARGALPRE